MAVYLTVSVATDSRLGRFPSPRTPAFVIEISPRWKGTEGQPASPEDAAH